jgi:hypothetical protein
LDRCETIETMPTWYPAQPATCTRRTSRFPLWIFSFRMTLCSRCHGTTPRGRLGPSSGLERLRTGLTRCASSLRWAGGFRGR